MTGSPWLAPEQLRTLFLFERLDDDQLAWLIERGRLVEYPAGVVIHAEGAPASCFLVLLSGTLSMSKRVQGGEIELFRTDYRGAYTGAFNAVVPDRGVPKVYPSTARAVTPCRLFEIPATEFGKAVWEWFPMAAHLLEGAATQGASASEIIERHERLVALGAVTAGLTHELNNPVAAVMRAAATLRDRLTGMRSDLGRLIRADLDPSQLEGIAGLVTQALERRRDASDLSPMEVSDREDEVSGWLEDHGVEASWELAPTFVAAGVDMPWLAAMADLVPPSHLEAGLTYPVRVLESDGLLDEITEAAGRISGLLASAKQYTQMDRAPLQTFDVHEGLDATLTMLGHKLGDGIKIVREYDRSLPHIAAYPAELNQCGRTSSTTPSTPWTAKAPSPCAPGPVTTSGWSWRSPTPDRACPTKSAAGSSSRSSPPSRWARAPASASISPGASSSGATTARSASSRPRATHGSTSSSPSGSRTPRRVSAGIERGQGLTPGRVPVNDVY